MKRFFTLIAAAMTFMASGWSQTVTDIVVNSENHALLEAAVIEAGLDGTLSGPGPFTLFAPTDDAFNALLTDLDITVDSLLNIPILAEILTYHVVADSVVSDSLVEGGTATTVYGADVTFSLMGGPMVNNANIGPADNLADNGVVHVIDAVLLPLGCTDTTACNYDELALFDDGSCVLPGDSCDDGDDATVNDAIGEDCGCAGIPATVVDIVVGSEAHNVLEAAVATAGLVDALSAEGPFTVFAPTDAAFEALLAALNVEDTDLLALAELTQILTYHVASGAVMSSELTDGQTVPTLNGQDLTISIMNDTVTVNGTAIVTVADVEAGNGVVHIIDGVLVPDTITGCTNAEACNYSLVATDDDMTCEVPGDECDDGDAATDNDVIGEDCACAGEVASTVTERTKEWFITPNPASDIVVLSGLTASSKVSLVDLTGRTVREFVQGASVLSVGDMPRGTYLLTVTEGRNIQTKKVVVQ